MNELKERRERIAKDVLVKLVCEKSIEQAQQAGEAASLPVVLAVVAVAFADALIAELDKKP